MTAIEELEKLASDVADRVVIGLGTIASTLHSLLPRLRAEERDKLRAAFVAGAQEPVGGIDWSHDAIRKIKRHAKKQAERRYT